MQKNTKELLCQKIIHKTIIVYIMFFLYVFIAKAQQSDSCVRQKENFSIIFMAPIKGKKEGTYLSSDKTPSPPSPIEQQGNLFTH